MDLEVLGPAPASVVKVNNRYRYRITVVGKCTAPVRRLLAAYMKEFARRKENRTLHILQSAIVGIKRMMEDELWHCERSFCRATSV